MRDGGERRRQPREQRAKPQRASVRPRSPRRRTDWRRCRTARRAGPGASAAPRTLSRFRPGAARPRSATGRRGRRRPSGNSSRDKASSSRTPAARPSSRSHAASSPAGSGSDEPNEHLSAYWCRESASAQSDADQAEDPADRVARARAPRRARRRSRTPARRPRTHRPPQPSAARPSAGRVLAGSDRAAGRASPTRERQRRRPTRCQAGLPRASSSSRRPQPERDVRGLHRLRHDGAQLGARACRASTSSRSRVAEALERPRGVVLAPVEATVDAPGSRTGRTEQRGDRQRRARDREVGAPRSAGAAASCSNSTLPR